MARLTRVNGRLLLQPSTGDERLLLAAACPPGQLLLDDASYPVSQGSLALPAGLSRTRALRLLGLFERAADSHARAEARRRAFKIVR